jgi:hypothetical protein
MRNKKFTFCAIILFTIALTGLNAQETITATGGNASGSGGSASYTAGQVVYYTYTGASGSVAEGVQQPFEISTITSIKDSEGINLFIKAYPNPVNEALTLQVDESDISNLYFQMFDMHGSLIQNERITNRLTSIYMSNLAPATYIIKIVEGNTEIKSFKIIKN